MVVDELMYIELFVVFINTRLTCHNVSFLFDLLNTQNLLTEKNDNGSHPLFIWPSVCTC